MMSPEHGAPAPQRAPHISTLSRTDSEALLARHHVGRLAFAFRDRVDIEPIHYVFADGRIYGRTQFGTKVDVLAHHPWVAFEVDEIDAIFDWRSVVVHGRVVFPNPEGPAHEQEQFARGVDVFRRLVPAAFADGDPTPARELVFFIHVHELSGRAASTTDTGVSA